MAIDRERLLHVAHLARLELREDEIERMGVQLNDILAAVSKVSELDLSDVPPTSHPLDVVNVWADDEPRPSLPVEEALRNAPEREGNFFKVPPGAEPSKSDRPGGADVDPGVSSMSVPPGGTE
jgi:aspartyl-tRNA(Asn)/glutamyl-tRNA(Gln) amidotransferase subunit C